jgi:hypothetical protein
MEEFCNERGRAALMGTFAFNGRVLDPESGKDLGNTFHATICSLLCAHNIFAGGGWRNLEHYAPFVKADALLARAEVCVTAYVLDEKKAIKEWEETPDK